MKILTPTLSVLFVSVDQQFPVCSFLSEFLTHVSLVVALYGYPFILQEGKSKDSFVVFLRSSSLLNTCLRRKMPGYSICSWVGCHVSVGKALWGRHLKAGEQRTGGEEAESPSDVLTQGWATQGPSVISHCARPSRRGRILI